MKRLLACATLLAAAAFLAGCTAVAHDGGASPLAAGSPLPVPTAGPGQVLVSVLGDSHSGFAGSWFEQSVAAGDVPGAAPGVLSSHPGRAAAALHEWIVEATRYGGTVLVQAGTNDLLLEQHTPAQAAADVEDLVTTVARDGVQAVLVSVPPSATLGGATNQLNGLLTAWTSAHQVPWLDVTSAVSEADGTWRPGMSSDGIHANPAGGRVMADAVRAQLPGILTRR